MRGSGFEERQPQASQNFAPSKFSAPQREQFINLAGDSESCRDGSRQCDSLYSQAFDPWPLIAWNTTTSTITAPIAATRMLGRLTPVTPARPSAWKIAPPTDAPTIPSRMSRKPFSRAIHDFAADEPADESDNSHAKILI